MNKGLEQTFLHIRQTNGQQECENTLNVTNPLGNTNQNHNEMLPHITQITIKGKEKKEKKMPRVGEGVEKLELLCTAGRHVKWCGHYGKQYGGSSKNLKYDSAIPLLV